MVVHIKKILDGSDMPEEEIHRYKSSVDKYIAEVKNEYITSCKGNQQQLYYQKLCKDGKISKEDMYVSFCLVNFLKHHKGALTEELIVTQE